MNPVRNCRTNGVKRKNKIFAPANAPVLFFLMLFCICPPSLSDEITTSDGRKYEGIIIDQSPSAVTLRIKDETIQLKRADLKYIKRGGREKNNALTESWNNPAATAGSAKARTQELAYADSIRYSDQLWQIYEEDTFIAFHHNEAIIKSRLKGKIGDYCKKVSEKLGFDDFKLYDKTDSPDWNLKFKFYSYHDFESWKKLVEAKGFKSVVDAAAAFSAGHRRVLFYELYLRMDAIYHELSHEIYRELTDNAKIPLWWAEGIAEYTSLPSGEAAELVSESKFRAVNNRFIPLKTETYSYEHVYSDGLSIVFFIKEKGKDKFKKFNYNLKNGKSFEESLSEVYGFKDIDALQAAGVEYLKKTGVKDIINN